MFVERVNRWCGARSKEQGARSDRAGARTSGRGEVERSRAAREGHGVGGGGVRKRRLETATSKEQQGRTEANTGEECEGGTREGRTGRGFGSDDPDPLACE